MSETQLIQPGDIPLICSALCDAMDLRAGLVESEPPGAHRDRSREAADRYAELWERLSRRAAPAIPRPLVASSFHDALAHVCAQSACVDESLCGWTAARKSRSGAKGYAYTARQNIELFCERLPAHGLHKNAIY